MNVSLYMHCKISGWENEGILWDFNSSVNELPDEEWCGICLNKERIHLMSVPFKFLLHKSCLSLYTKNKYCSHLYSYYFFVRFWKPLALWLCVVHCISEILTCFE
jgi:hypothetical protein